MNGIKRILAIAAIAVVIGASVSVPADASNYKAPHASNYRSNF